MAHNIQISIQPELLSQVDQTVKKMGKNRSAFIAEALRSYLSLLKTRWLEKQHIQGYRKSPTVPEEFDIWPKEQVWPDP
ncbi:MAG: ribbon-helix-helix protein, CopG family [Deltaproteobacteria bacterium]|nr:ribbon-helix-helix protein, CopG family [Deltaproteobacteria bacterium]